MNKFLVDTNVWIDFLNKRKPAIELIDLLSKEGKMYSSILTVTELRAGFTNERAELFLPIFYSQNTKIIEVTIKIAELAGKFLQDYKTRGISLPMVDTLIGSTAVIEKCNLVTGNKKDFPMKEIKFYEF